MVYNYVHLGISVVEIFASSSSWQLTITTSLRPAGVLPPDLDLAFTLRVGAIRFTHGVASAFALARYGPFASFIKGCHAVAFASASRVGAIRLEMKCG